MFVFIVLSYNLYRRRDLGLLSRMNCLPKDYSSAPSDTFDCKLLYDEVSS